MSTITLLPSITTNVKKPEASETFQHITTARIVSALEGTGFHVSGMGEQRTRAAHRSGYQKHIVELKRDNWAIDANNQMRVLLRNANDGTSALFMTLGIFRLVCSNGLMVGNPIFSTRIAHSGNIEPKIAAGIEYLYNMGPKLVEQVRAMQERQLSDEQGRELMRRIVSLRAPETTVSFTDIFSAQREEDKTSDVWTLFNRAQERLVRGNYGFRTMSTRGDGGTRLYNRIARPIKGIDRLVKLNREAWNIATEYASA